MSNNPINGSIYRRRVIELNQDGFISLGEEGKWLLTEAGWRVLCAYAPRKVAKSDLKKDNQPMRAAQSAFFCR